MSFGQPGRATYALSGIFRRRIHKTLQCANIKIDSVVSDLFGVTGRNLMKLLIHQQSNVTLAQIEQCCRGTLRSKSEKLYGSIKGFFTNHHSYVLSTLLETVETLEAQIENITRALRSMMTDYNPPIARLDTIPGINEIGAMGVLSHVGAYLAAFPSAAAFCQWQGLCPGNNQSADKRYSGKPVVRKHPLKTLFIELAQSIMYLKYGKDFQELGPAYLDRLNKSAKSNPLRAQASAMGFILSRPKILDSYYLEVDY